MALEIVWSLLLHLDYRNLHTFHCSLLASMSTKVKRLYGSGVEPTCWNASNCIIYSNGLRHTANCSVATAAAAATDADAPPTKTNSCQCTAAHTRTARASATNLRQLAAGVDRPVKRSQSSGHPAQQSQPVCCRWTHDQSAIVAVIRCHQWRQAETPVIDVTWRRHQAPAKVGSTSRQSLHLFQCHLPASWAPSISHRPWIRQLIDRSDRPDCSFITSCSLTRDAQL